MEMDLPESCIKCAMEGKPSHHRAIDGDDLAMARQVRDDGEAFSPSGI